MLIIEITKIFARAYRLFASLALRRLDNAENRIEDVYENEMRHANNFREAAAAALRLAHITEADAQQERTTANGKLLASRNILLNAIDDAESFITSI